MASRLAILTTCVFLISCARTTNIEFVIALAGPAPTAATVEVSIHGGQRCPAGAALSDLSGLGSPIERQVFAIGTNAMPFSPLDDGSYALVARVREPNTCELLQVGCTEWTAGSSSRIEIVMTDPFSGVGPACGDAMVCTDGTCAGGGLDGGLDAGLDGAVDAGADEPEEGGPRDAGDSAVPGDGGPFECAAAGLPCMTMIATGDDFTCIANRDEMHCFGLNSVGQLGDGTTDSRSAPTMVTDLTGSIRDIATGASHTCALFEAGGVHCWGENDARADQFRLGDGTSLASRTRPGPVADIAGATALAVGYWHSCAVVPAGVRCWGQNGRSELGVGDAASYMTPAAVAQTDTTIIGAGLGVSCGVRDTDDDLWCWGFNNRGQVGDDTFTTQAVPVQVRLAAGAPLTGIRQVEGYGTVDDLFGHTCAVGVGGELYCWGDNRFGQLGLGDMDVRGSARIVPLLSSTAEVATGRNHTCARSDAGEVHCWGDNTHGQLSYADMGVNFTTRGPLVELPEPAVALAAGNHHTCALLTGGQVFCWGDNTAGQLGRSDASSATPMPVAWP